MQQGFKKEYLAPGLYVYCDLNDSTLDFFI